MGVAADVYMTGVLLQELLTFHPNGDLSARADCPAAWRDLIDDATHRNPKRRPRSIAEFRERLLGRSGEPSRTGTTAPRHAAVPVRSPEAVPAQPRSAPVPVAPAPERRAEPPREMVNSIGMKFMLIPAGTFVMGSPESEGGRSDEEQQHEVEITRPFYLGVYPVTQAQWRAVLGNNPSWFCATGGGKDKVKGMNTDYFPVEQVSWEDAVTFLKKLAALPEEVKEGRKYRLPSEAEWEYSCRGGVMSSSKPFHFKQPTSSLSSTQANFDGNFPYPYGGAARGPYRQTTTPVGSFEPNALGIYDMHGNVGEWCADWYDKDYYQNSPKADPPGPSGGSVRVLRGGSWFSYGQGCRAACRGGGRPSYRYDYLGFRVAAVPVRSEQGK